MTPNVRALVLLVAAAACIPYLPTIDDFFTQDDFGVVQLLASKPWTTFPRWFVMPWMEHIWGYTPDEIRPFVAFTYQVTAIPGAGRPELHHILNILIHAANAVLVMAIARRAIGLPPRASAFAGVVFALLPVQAESVAWITGRVDSMPAFFYFATFLAYVMWRAEPSGGPGAAPETPASAPATNRHYFAALALFFVALFSKQNTITMAATLATYDLLIVPRQRRGSIGALIKAWLPFALMTLGYLGLRRILFGASVRGGIESWHQVVAVGEIILRHTQRTVFGAPGPGVEWEWFGLVFVLTGVAVLAVRQRFYVRLVLCFAIAWWVIGVAPVLVAGYESPRHVYLAAAAWAWTLGLFFEANDRPVRGRQGWRRAIPIVFALAVASFYAVRLHQTVQTWGSWAAVSQRAVSAVSDEAAAAPEGTLLLVGVPQKSWEWAAPFVLQPPYSPRDLSTRVHLVTPFRLHCCGADAWNVYTRAQLAAWAAAGGSRPIIALHVDPAGRVSRVTDTEAPDLRSFVGVLPQTDAWQTLDDAILRILEQRVRGQ